MKSDIEVMPISSLTRQGIQELLYRAADLLDQIPDEPEVEEVAELSERKVYSLEKKRTKVSALCVRTIRLLWKVPRLIV